MGRMHTCEALVLKAYDIGDADRFCILLTDTRGRVPVNAKGVRKLSSKNGSAIQSFQNLIVDIAEHSSGLYLRSAKCLESYPCIREDLNKFTLASRASELLLHFLHDTEPSHNIFSLAKEYFKCCDDGGSSILFQTFELMLLKELGLLPSFASDKSLKDFGLAKAGNELREYLCLDSSFQERSKVMLSDIDKMMLDGLCDLLLEDHLSFPLRSVGVSQNLITHS
jgi:DNA repair protein RecO